MTKAVESYNAFLNTPLAEADPEVAKIIENEKYRQFAELELIASENFTSQAVMEANGSALTNKYSEGLPGARYYGGNEHIDKLERLCQERALAAFKLNKEEWGVNVQPYSGSTANFAALTALLQPFDRLMGLDLPSGGHLTHGYQTDKKKISSSSIYFQSMPYRVDAQSGLIDYDRLEENAELYRPQLLICGASAYPRDWDYARLRKIADKHSAYLLCDMAHISGLVAAGEQTSPFEFCDIVTTTTHKTLRGPRAGLIFFRRRAGEDRKDSLESRVNQAVFPSCQGGPHNNTIAGIAVALKQAASPEFVQYAKQVRANTQALARRLGEHGYRLSSGGSDNHLVLWDLKPQGLTGSKIEKVCELVNITLNKNSVCGDKSAVTPGGVRIGTSALTSRGFKEGDFEQVGDFLHRTVEIASELQQQAGSKLLKDFMAVAAKSDKITALQKEVEAFATSFPMPGFDVSTLTKPEH
ncbi:glycine hydroxymethyltransferase shm1 [Coemansia sp. RSA 989]|nr:serine hydroxymethyltransferase [Coemansia mojavensis]KAJ1744180.1 glycine hydroxymethyltransferase shm1 [Coemansia sp. RSA 1086]KAJ1750017.1 glycine hydroxymethyltransferase shm1 [Coemansia sp. RSA 1821]KAJ1867922.1 glycine hydroxymethyltransferase shm1 [Coemansia sp. RSA 989]KAJ1874475.1 glycine hydroxymethyltransferase shm1 [Coemansia sp. RSA 990]KAJ2633406.1 glycine hydroxymethyltransferase shm1 [Coemansia sp. RSA 1290]KAJ2653098.1 glycine hydroxymethyltransferase shm1 [Coemansia sp. R